MARCHIPVREREAAGSVGFAGGQCWGRPLLSRLRGAFGSGAAAVESAAESVIARSCGRAGVLVGLELWMVVRFFSLVLLCDPCARVRLACAPVCPRCVCPVSRVCVPAPPGVFLPLGEKGKKTPGGGAGTHTGHTRETGHTRDTRAHQGTRITPTMRRTSQPSKLTNTHPHVSATAETAADSTAAGPEPTAPRFSPVTGTGKNR